MKLQIQRYVPMMPSTEVVEAPFLEPRAAQEAMDPRDSTPGRDPNAEIAIARHQLFAGQYSGVVQRQVRDGAVLVAPEVKVDREVARLELSSKFQIVPPGTPKTKPNQVTEAEFEKIVGTYSDIRMDRSALRLDTANMTPAQAAAFKARAMEDVARVMQTETGRQVIDQINGNRNGNKTSIRGIENPAGASALPPGANPANAATITPAMRAAWADPSRGTDSILRYAPGRNVPESFSGCGDPICSDVTLLHELVHAMHQNKGTMKNQPATGVPADAAAGIPRYEHQATGVGSEADAALSERKYRDERRQLAGQPGAVVDGVEPDHYMARRKQYVSPQPGQGRCPSDRP